MASPTESAPLAPELDVVEWLGVPSSLESLRGRVVLVETFQMLCPGCIRYGLPQAQRVHRQFPQVAVVGLHTVFEHHAVTGSAALKVFLAEFDIRFPVGIDRHEDGRAMPVTMRQYGLQGTPSTLLIDRAGRLRFSHLGAVDDLVLGVLLGELLADGADAATAP
ncbi:MAG TPA: TlpA disulfide reductase family protein [Mycobacterium sp.]|nr:TlpA disulfide reductase family protein [Mycobacterium sp.]